MKLSSATTIVKHACSKDNHKPQMMIPWYDKAKNVMIAADGFRIAIAHSDEDMPEPVYWEGVMPESHIWAAKIVIDDLMEIASVMKGVGNGIVKLFLREGWLTIRGELASGDKAETRLDVEIIKGDVTADNKVALNAAYLVDFCNAVKKMKTLDKEQRHSWEECVMYVIDTISVVKITSGPSEEYIELIMPTSVQWGFPEMEKTA